MRQPKGFIGIWMLALCVAVVSLLLVAPMPKTKGKGDFHTGGTHCHEAHPHEAREKPHDLLTDWLGEARTLPSLRRK